MPGRWPLAIVAALCAAVGCSRQADDTRPVATPSVTVSRPDTAVGSPLDVTYRFDVSPEAPPLDEDYLVFAHFMNADREQMWTDDHEPEIPTRQWKPGQTVEYTRTIFIPKFPYVGEVAIEVGLYSPGSGDRLPLAGQHTGMRAYRAASFNMRLEAENLFVVFKDGWHDTEVSEDGGLEWQWSTKLGTISFRNPRRDAQLILQVDQAVAALSEPQQVTVRMESTVLDTFTLPHGDRVLRRIALPAATLGSADTVDAVIEVDRTFVPADVPSLRSADARELGIRVFRAYVEPR